MDPPTEACPYRAAILDTIPREITVHILSFIKKESLFANIDVPLDELVIMAKIYAKLQGVSKKKALLSTEVYFPLNNLYRTSKAYSWMREYEFVDVYSIDTRALRFKKFAEKKIKIRDINGKTKHFVEICENELMCYQIGKNSNIYDWSDYSHRLINDVEYAEDYYHPCKRVYNICSCSSICEQLNAIQVYISRADSVIGDICAADTIDSHIIMRPINTWLNELNIKFDTSGMIPVVDNPYY